MDFLKVGRGLLAFFENSIEIQSYLNELQINFKNE